MTIFKDLALISIGALFTLLLMSRDLPSPEPTDPLNYCPATSFAYVLLTIKGQRTVAYECLDGKHPDFRTPNYWERKPQ